MACFLRLDFFKDSQTDPFFYPLFVPVPHSRHIYKKVCAGGDSSSLHPTLIANTIARFIPLDLFVTRHPYPHLHHLSALTLFITCSHC